MIGLGCMRLSTLPERDETSGVAVIHAALDAGATLLDTADVYCHGEHEIGHNERLIARALSMWSGERGRIEIATKGGLRRSGSQWLPDGRAKHLRAACDASRRALGAEAIDLYQLHAVDPKTSIATSVRALAALKKEGLVRRVGLCNVTVNQIQAAREIVEIASVQVSLGVLDDENLRNGVAEYCREHEIRLIAYRPLGGDRSGRLTRDPVLLEIAAAHDATPHEIALAWLLDLHPVVMPIPGATRETNARSLGRVLALHLTSDERALLDGRFAGRLLRVPRAERRPRDGAEGDVVVIMGMPGAGKTGVAQDLAGQGYERLNRDERGGVLTDLVPALEAGLEQGRRRWVLDNTYPTRRARNEVIECAWAHGAPVRCVWLTTTVADAQINSVERMLAVHGRLPTPEEIRELGKGDPRYLGPDAQFRYERTLEPPVVDEGFARVDERAFVRRDTPGYTGAAVILEYDDVLCVSARGDAVAITPEDVTVPSTSVALLARYAEQGVRLLAQAWRPQIARGETDAARVAACFARTRELLGLDIEFAHCPHDAGPPVCWCRKPLPGLVLEFVHRYRLSPARCIAVGRSPADRGQAVRLGFPYFDYRELVSPEVS